VDNDVRSLGLLIKFLGSTKLDWIEAEEIEGRKGVRSYVRVFGYRDTGWHIDFCFDDNGDYVAIYSLAD
jgi:hypothetical protein